MKRSNKEFFMKDNIKRSTMNDLRVTTSEIKATICFDKDTRIEGTIFLGTGQWASRLRAR